jgi:hypothetical protein
MLGRMGFAVITLATIMFSPPSNAAFLLNCRLMGPDTPSRWRQGCQWETVISVCKPGEPCKVKRQNFLSLSAKAAITANVKLRTAVIVSGTTAEAASLAAAMNSPGLAASSNSTAASSTVSGTIGGAAGTVDGIASAVTGTVDRAVAGLVP